LQGLVRFGFGVTQRFHYRIGKEKKYSFKVYGRNAKDETDERL
jgi:hypothetical protein